MTGQSEPVNIEILDKEYLVSCPPEEREALIESARQLNARLKAVRDGGKVLGTERMAVMTALNVIHEYSQLQREYEDCAGALERMRGKLARAISRREESDALD